MPRITEEQQKICEDLKYDFNLLNVYSLYDGKYRVSYASGAYHSFKACIARRRRSYASMNTLYKGVKRMTTTLDTVLISAYIQTLLYPNSRIDLFQQIGIQDSFMKEINFILATNQNHAAIRAKTFVGDKRNYYSIPFYSIQNFLMQQSPAQLAEIKSYFFDTVRQYAKCPHCGGKLDINIVQNPLCLSCGLEGMVVSQLCLYQDTDNFELDKVALNYNLEVR